ncbi:uncharacterized protein [Asterias amurensis]|uniref:uncharacterized protein n=1 Tax=Asterias amurensis TaxID=7602 RepID=UPI003AB41636
MNELLVKIITIVVTMQFSQGQPTIETSANSITVLVGSNVTLICTVMKGLNMIPVRWTTPADTIIYYNKTESPYRTAVNSNLIINSVKESAAGKYTCDGLIFNGHYTFLSSTDLHVVPYPTVELQDPCNVWHQVDNIEPGHVCVRITRSILLFNCNVYNITDGASTITWTINGDEVIGDEVYVTSAVTPGNGQDGLSDTRSSLYVALWADEYQDEVINVTCHFSGYMNIEPFEVTAQVKFYYVDNQVVLVGAFGAVFAVCVLTPFVTMVVCCCLRRRRLRLTQPSLNDNQGTAAAEDGGYLVPSRAVRPKLHKQEEHVKKQEGNQQRDILLSDMTVEGVYDVTPEVKASMAATKKKKKKESRYDNLGPDLSFPRNRLTIEGDLGSGAFGKVLLGTATGIEQSTSRTKVAVKTLKEGADRFARTELLQELELMKKIPYHPNVVGLLGYCIDKDPIYVIVEYLAKGDLKMVLIDLRSEDTERQYCNLMENSLSKTLIRFARDVACGMAFLASQKCIHRDLAARNVLVGDDMECKVSDFGLARDVMNIRVYQRQSQGPLPMRWMALESILDDVYTTESDVWSFGILLWEITTLGARPYPLMGAKKVLRKIKRGYRMPIPNGCMYEMYELMLDCWRDVPSKRPSFQNIYDRLTEFLNDDKHCIAVDEFERSNDEFVMTIDMMEKV